MDTHLKERLVGAAVLVAAAVILIPEMLSGPAEQLQPEQPQDASADAGVRSYTIDLAGRPREAGEVVQDDPPEIETPMPPPEEVVDLPEVAPPPAVAETAPPARVAEVPARPITPPVAAEPDRPVPPVPPPPATTVRMPWAVQVGSFAKPDTAERLGQDLRKRGYTVYVVPFRNGAQTLYRVRIGPIQDRKAADATVQKLKSEGTVATVVPNS